MAKPDRKALMRKSIEAVPRGDSARRLELAEQAMIAHPRGLMSPAVATTMAHESSSTASAGNLLRVPISNVHDNPYNARRIYDQEAIKELALSLATEGQLVPAPVVPHPSMPGHYVLIDGHYRKKSLLHAGKDEILCLAGEPVDGLQLYRLSFEINEKRNAQSPLDNAMAWRHLLDEKRVESAADIAELVGLSKGQVSKTLALLDLPPSALAKIQEKPGKFSLKVGYELTLFATQLAEPDLLALIDKVVEEDLSSRQLEAMRDKSQNARPRKPKETSRQYKIRRDGAVIGAIKDWDSGKVAFEIKLPDARQREELLGVLKQHFGLDDMFS